MRVNVPHPNNVGLKTRAMRVRLVCGHTEVVHPPEFVNPEFVESSLAQMWVMCYDCSMGRIMQDLAKGLDRGHQYV